MESVVPSPINNDLTSFPLLFVPLLLGFLLSRLVHPSSPPPSTVMNGGFDCRDRTSEFFSTIQQIQKAQSHLSAGGISGSHPLPTSLADATSHRPLPKSTSNTYHNEFDDRPEGEALIRSNAVQPKQQSQFTQAAQHIGRSIHTVTEKLEKLGKCMEQTQKETHGYQRRALSIDHNR